MSTQAPSIVELNLLPKAQRPAEVSPLAIVFGAAVIVAVAALVPLSLQAHAARSDAQAMQDRASVSEAGLHDVQLDLARQRALRAEVEQAKADLASVIAVRRQMQGGARPLHDDFISLYGLGIPVGRHEDHGGERHGSRVPCRWIRPGPPRCHRLCRETQDGGRLSRRTRQRLHARGEERRPIHGRGGAMNVAFAALFGLALGSFANAAIDRIPRGASLNGRSHCDGCGDDAHRAYQLIPVISYVAQRGRCLACAAPIGIRTPIVEGGTAIAFAAAFATLTAPMAVAACAALVATIIAAGALHRETRHPMSEAQPPATPRPSALDGRVGRVRPAPVPWHAARLPPPRRTRAGARPRAADIARTDGSRSR